MNFVFLQYAEKNSKGGNHKMTPVYQTVVDQKKGNCMQAAFASLFDLDLTQVPNLILFEKHQWWYVAYYFLYALGYDYDGTLSNNITIDAIEQKVEDINGAIYASAKSRTFDNVGHAVLIDRLGNVIHDPNPNQKFLGVNIIETKEIECIWMISKRKEEQS